MANDGMNRGGARPGVGRKKKMPDGTFEHAAFTAEQLKELTDSSHVAYVSSKSVSYTKAFKDAAWQRYCDGIDPVRIFVMPDSMSIRLADRVFSDWILQDFAASKGKGAAFHRWKRPVSKRCREENINPGSAAARKPRQAPGNDRSRD